jgi:hypothetical protein
VTVTDASSPDVPAGRGRKPDLKAVSDEGPPPPPAGTDRIPGMGSWAYRAGVDPGIWHLPNGADDWMRKLYWCPQVKDAVRYATQDGRRTINKQFTIQVGDQSEVVSLSDLSRGAAMWGRFSGASGYSGRNIGDVLANIVSHQATGLPDLTGYPMFRDGHLVLPPTPYLADGYTNGEGSDPRALRMLVQAIAPYPRAALIFGLSAAAPWITPLQLQPFTFHVVGDTTTGKTTAITAASALWGTGFKGVTATWYGTKNGVPGQLRDLGVLPMFRDELSTAGLSGPDRATLFSVVMEGCKRAARTRDDLPRPSATWGSILFSTGNIAAVPEQHASAGHPKGVIEIHADERNPVLPEDVKDRIKDLTNDPGTAGAWVPIAKKLSLAAMQATYADVGAKLGKPEGNPLGWHMWRAMSLGVAGARALGIALKVPDLETSAMIAAREIIDGAADRMAEIGADHGQRLVDTLTEYLSIRPAAFGLTREEDMARTDQMGFQAKTRDGHTITCVFPSRHGEISRAAGVEDVTVALRQLRTDGRLIVSKGQGLKYRARRDGSLIPVYAYRLADPETATRTSGDSGQNSQNNQNNPGQGTDSCSDQAPATSEQAPGRSEQEVFGGWPDGSVGADVNQLERPFGTDDGVVQDHEPAPAPASVAVIATCETCGEAMRVIESGQRHHPMCEPESAPEPIGAAPEPAPAPVPAAPENTPIATSRRQDAATSRRPVSELDTAEELEAFARALRKHGLDKGATDADLAAALALFSEVTGGLRWVSYAGQTGQAAFARMLARNGSMKPPTVLTDDRAVKIMQDERVPVTRYHVRMGMGRKLKPGATVTGFDINGQYPAAAASAELGDGNPEWKTRPRSVEGMWAKPGYVKLAAPVRAPKVPELKLIKNDGTVPTGGDWLPMPVVRFLGEDLGLTVEAAEVMWWPRSGRRLRAFIDRTYREPRATLRAMPGSVVRDLALSALKMMVNDSIGMLRSETWSSGRWYRPDWNDQITSLSEMNALRAIRKCEVPPLVKACDSLYWVAEPPCEACAGNDRAPAEMAKAPDPPGHREPCGKPKGLVVSGQLGKFKVERHAVVTPEMTDAYKNASAKSFHEAVKAAVTAQQDGDGQ